MRYNYIHIEQKPCLNIYQISSEVYVITINIKAAQNKKLRSLKRLNTLTENLLFGRINIIYHPRCHNGISDGGMCLAGSAQPD